MISLPLHSHITIFNRSYLSPSIPTIESFLLEISDFSYLFYFDKLSSLFLRLPIFKVLCMFLMSNSSYTILSITSINYWTSLYISLKNLYNSLKYNSSLYTVPSLYSALLFYGNFFMSASSGLKPRKALASYGW